MLELNFKLVSFAVFKAIDIFVAIEIEGMLA